MKQENILNISFLNLLGVFLFDFVLNFFFVANILNAHPPIPRIKNTSVIGGTGATIVRTSHVR